MQISGPSRDGVRRQTPPRNCPTTRSWAENPSRWMRSFAHEFDRGDTPSAACYREIITGADTLSYRSTATTLTSRPLMSATGRRASRRLVSASTCSPAEMR